MLRQPLTEDEIEKQNITAFPYLLEDKILLFLVSNNNLKLQYKLVDVFQNLCFIPQLLDIFMSSTWTST